MKRITIKAAKAAGLKQFFTDKPCKFGHTSARYTSSRACVQCVNDYQRTDRWRAQRRDYYKLHHAVKKTNNEQQD